MSFLDWLVTKKKPLSKMTRSELRRQELLLEKDRTQLLKRVKKLATDKQDMFNKTVKQLFEELLQVHVRIEGFLLKLDQEI